MIIGQGCRVAVLVMITAGIAASSPAQDAPKQGGGGAPAFVEDARGGSQVAPLGLAAGSIRFNVAEKLATLGWLRRSSSRGGFLSAEAAAAIANNVGSIFSGGDIQPAGRLSILAGWMDVSRREDPSVTTIPWYSLRVGVEGARYTLLDTSSAFATQVSKRSYGGWSLQASANALFSGRFIGAISIGANRENNATKLEEVEVETVRQFGVGTASRLVRSKVTAREGAFKERTVAPIGLDLFWLPEPGEPIGVSAYARQVLSEEAPVSRLGIGAWALKPGAPAQTLGGVIVELDDVFEKAPKPKRSEEKRLKVTLIVAFPLFNR